MSHDALRASTTTIARTIGTLAAAVWLVPILATLVGADDPGSDGPSAEGMGVGVLAIANIAAVAIAWRNARLGGALLLGTGALFAVFAILTAERNEWLAVAVSGGPFLLAGVLLLLGSRHRSNDTSRHHTPRRDAKMAQ